VTGILLNARRNSPTSTLLLSSSDLTAVEDSATQIRLVLRALRCVSPYPWGSPRAEARRNTKNLQLAAQRLCSTSQQRASFTVGGSVLWTPVAILSDGTTRQRPASISAGEELGWLLSRSPPFAKNQNPHIPTKSIEEDVTLQLIRAMTKDFLRLEILWDCRFLISFDLKRLQQVVNMNLNKAQVKIVPEGRFLLPRVVICREDEEELAVQVDFDGHNKGTGLVHASFVRSLSDL
jgi:tRNA(Ile)-lysidine synthase